MISSSGRKLTTYGTLSISRNRKMEFCPWTDDKDLNLNLKDDGSDDEEDMTMTRNNDEVVDPNRVSAKQALSLSNEERENAIVLRKQLSGSQKTTQELRIKLKSLLQDLQTKTNYIYCLQLEITSMNQKYESALRENQNLKLLLQDECQRRMYAEHCLALLEAQNQKTS